jgi:hypothetical protein
VSFLRRLFGTGDHGPAQPTFEFRTELSSGGAYEDDELAEVTVGGATTAAAVYRDNQRDVQDWSSGFRLEDPLTGSMLTSDDDYPELLAEPDGQGQAGGVSGWPIPFVALGTSRRSPCRRTRRPGGRGSRDPGSPSGRTRSATACASGEPDPVPGGWRAPRDAREVAAGLRPVGLVVTGDSCSAARTQPRSSRRRKASRHTRPARHISPHRCLAICRRIGDGAASDGLQRSPRCRVFRA